MMRGKRTAQTACRGCGAPVEGGGDMCANCRHEAAESHRRAIAERAEEERLQAETARREAERRDEEARREQARRDETLRLAAQAEQQRREDKDRRLQQAQAQHAAEEAAVFDPYAVLGLTPDATADQVRAAYEQAKGKYDASQYEHFGGELQAHFKAKAEAVERAFQMLYVSE
jgi:dTMP kinase